MSKHSYTEIEFKNAPDHKTTPLNAANLNHIEAGITDAFTDISETQEVIAPVEDTLTASQAYAVGDQFIYQNKLYKATAAIPSGGTITPNGNCELANSIVEQIQIVTVTDNVTTGNYGEATIDNTKLTANMTPIVAYSSVQNTTIHLIYSDDNQSWRIWAEKIDGTPYFNANFDVYIKAFKAR